MHLTKRLLSNLYVSYFAPNANSFVFIRYEDIFGDGGPAVGNNKNEQFTEEDYRLYCTGITAARKWNIAKCKGLNKINKFVF